MKHFCIKVVKSSLILLLFSFFNILEARDLQKTETDSIVKFHQDSTACVVSKLTSLVCGMDTLCENVSSIHKDVNSLSDDINSYIRETKGSWDWGTLFTLLSIIVMIVVYLFTRSQTNKQIENQNADTVNKLAAQKTATEAQINAQAQNTQAQIEAQRIYSENQIKAIQTQSTERIKSLETMGEKIREYTEGIQKSVKHFEDKYLASNDNAIIESSLSEMRELHELIINKMNDDYDHFDNESTEEKVNQQVYVECYAKIKKYTEKISRVLNSCQTNTQLLNSEPYLQALKAVIFTPSLLDMGNQKKELKIKGDEYYEAVNSVKSSLFNNPTIKNE